MPASILWRCHTRREILRSVLPCHGRMRGDRGGNWATACRVTFRRRLVRMGSLRPIRRVSKSQVNGENRSERESVLRASTPYLLRISVYLRFRFGHLTSTPWWGIMGALMAVLPSWRGWMSGLEGAHVRIYWQDLVGRCGARHRRVCGNAGCDPSFGCGHNTPNRIQRQQCLFQCSQFDTVTSIGLRSRAISEL